jgi:hypothetical protein
MSHSTLTATAEALATKLGARGDASHKAPQ